MKKEQLKMFWGRALFCGCTELPLFMLRHSHGDRSSNWHCHAQSAPRLCRNAETVGCTVKSLDVISVKHNSPGISVDKIPPRSKQITTGNISLKNLERKVRIN
jgi:hypothetical protein